MIAKLSTGLTGGGRGSHRRRYLLVMLLAVAALGMGAAASRAQEGNKVLSLDEAYKMALQTHEQIQIAEKEVRKSRLLPYKAFSLMLPHVETRGGYSQVNKPINSTVGNLVILPKEQTAGEIKVSNALFNPEFFPLRRKAHEVIDKNVSNYFQTIQNVLLAVGLEYYQVLRAGELVQNARELLKTAQEEIRVSKVKFNAGAVTEDAVLRAELDMATAENKLIESSNFLRLARSTLKSHIALSTGNYEIAKPAPLPEVRESYDTLLSKAYEHRYDHKIALAEVELAKTEVDLVKAKFQPTVDAGWDYYALKHPRFDQHSNNWTAMVTVRMPLAEGGLRFWEVKEKNEGLAQAKLALEDKRRNIKIEVEDAMLTTQNNKSLMMKLQAQVDLAQKSYDIIFSKFKHGAATIMEVSQAFAALNSSKTDLINKTYDYQTSLLKLDKAEGVFVLALMRGASSLNGDSPGLLIKQNPQTRPEGNKKERGQ